MKTLIPQAKYQNHNAASNNNRATAYNQCKPVENPENKPNKIEDFEGTKPRKEKS